MKGLDAFKQAVSERTDALTTQFNPIDPNTELEFIILSLRAGQWLDQGERITVAKTFARALFLIDAFKAQESSFSNMWNHMALVPCGLEIQINYFIFFTEENTITDNLQFGQCRESFSTLHFFSKENCFKQAPFYVSFKLYYDCNVATSLALIDAVLQQQYQKIISSFTLELFAARLEKIQFREATIHLIKQHFVTHTESKPGSDHPLVNASTSLLGAIKEAINLYGRDQPLLSLIWGTLILEESQRWQTKYFVENTTIPKIISFYTENNQAFTEYLSPMYQLTNNTKLETSKRNLILFRYTHRADTSGHEWLDKFINNMTSEWTVLPIALDSVKKRIFKDKNIRKCHETVLNALHVESNASIFFQRLIAFFSGVQEFCVQHIQALPEWIWGSQERYQQWLHRYQLSTPDSIALVAFINYSLWCDFIDSESAWKCIFLRYDPVSSILEEQQARGLGINLGFSAFPSLQDLRAWDQIFDLVVTKTAIGISEEFQRQYTETKTQAKLLPLWTHNINGPIESVNRAIEHIEKGVKESSENVNRAIEHIEKGVKESLEQPLLNQQQSLLNQQQLLLNQLKPAQSKLNSLPIYYNSIRYKTRRIAVYTKLITAMPKLNTLVESEFNGMNGNQSHLYEQVIGPVFSHLLDRLILATDPVSSMIRKRFFQVKLRGILESQKSICCLINEQLCNKLYGYDYAGFDSNQSDTLEVHGLCRISDLHNVLEKVQIANELSDSCIKSLINIYEATTDTYYLNQLKIQEPWLFFSSVLKMPIFYKNLNLCFDKSLYSFFIPESDRTSYLKILCIEALTEAVWNALKHGNESDLNINMQVDTSKQLPVFIVSITNSFADQNSGTGLGRALIGQIVEDLKTYASFSMEDTFCIGEDGNTYKLTNSKICFSCKYKENLNNNV